jgi:transcriptional regulator with XRE-family HTH domain
MVYFNTLYCCYVKPFKKWGSTVMASLLFSALPMHFPARLIQLRKAAGLTQQTLSEAAELHVNQIRRYEAGTAQPTLEALIRLAKALHVSLDTLVFDEAERGPDEEFKLRFEALTQLDAGERAVVRELLDGMLLKHQARRLAGGITSGVAA